MITLIWTAPVVTEKADLDGQLVDLAPFICTDTPRSTLVQQVCYNTTERQLLIRVRGTFRRYCDVSWSTYNSFMTARSMGHNYKQIFAASDWSGRFSCPRLALRQNEKGPT